PEPTIFHPAANWVVISEGLVRECKTEAQLAAVLCQELGRIESERQGEALARAQLMAREPPPAFTVGNQVGGPFGDADGTGRAGQVRAAEPPARQPRAAARGPAGRPGPRLPAEGGLPRRRPRRSDAAAAQGRDELPARKTDDRRPDRAVVGARRSSEAIAPR